jgi:hypothetical protein
LRQLRRKRSGPDCAIAGDCRAAGSFPEWLNPHPDSNGSFFDNAQAWPETARRLRCRNLFSDIVATTAIGLRKILASFGKGTSDHSSLPEGN